MATTKQIKDFDLQTGINGNEDILIQNNGVTKRVKASEFMNSNIDLNDYYTKSQVEELLKNLNVEVDMADYYNKVEIDELLKNLNVEADMTDYYNKATIDELLSDKAKEEHTHITSEITDLSIPNYGYLVSEFSDYVEDGDWTPAIHKAIEVANENKSHVVVDGMYDIKTQITIPTNTTIQGHGFTYGVCGFNLLTSGITAVEIRGVAITFKNLVIKTTRSDVETHGLVLSASNEPDTNMWHGFCNIRDIRVSGFNGYGIKFDSIQDSLVENISIEHCGNANCYAFWVGSTTDTSNHTVFNRIQVEQAYTSSMFVSISTLCCTFENIHSERVHEISQSIYTHRLRGSACSYINCRIENSETDELLRPRIELGGSTSTYEAFITDASITNIVETNRRWGYFKHCNLRNVKHGTISTAKFFNCKLDGLSVTSETCYFDGCELKNVTLGYTVDLYKYFINCNITDFGYDSSFNKGIFNNCEFSVSTMENLKLSPACTYENCKFNCITRALFDLKILVQDSSISEFWLQGANTQITLINNQITTFTRETGLNNKLTWINNIYSGEITKDNDNDIIVLPVNSDSSSTDSVDLSNYVTKDELATIPTHTHDNKTVIDEITSEKVTQWDSGEAQTINGYALVVLTETEYSSLANYDENTIYLIRG